MYDKPDDILTGYRFIDIAVLADIFSAMMLCPDCGASVKLKQLSKKGLAFNYAITC